jgi:hypothetical protein
MALEKVISVDLIEVVSSGCVQVRTQTAINENGKQISATYHRHVVVPGADYSSEDAKVQAICAVIHTPEIISAYQALVQQQQIPA